MSTDSLDAPDAPVVEPSVDGLPPDAEPDSPAPEPGFLDKLAAQGIDVSKYQDEDAAIAGIASAVQMSGRKTQDFKRVSERLQMLEERLGEEGITRLIEGKSPDTPTNRPVRDIIPTSQLAHWQSLYDQGTLPDDDKSKFIQRTLQHQAVANDIANGDIPETLMPAIEALVADRLDLFKDEHSQATAAESAKQAAATAEQEFWGRHAKELLLDPEAGPDSGYTPLGQKVAKLYYNDPELAGAPEGIARLALAYRLAAPQSTPAKPSPKVPPTAKHDAGTKATPVKRDRNSFIEKYGRAPKLRELAVWKGELPE